MLSKTNIPKFYKQDREEKKNGGFRTILKPTHCLKCFQRKILKNILEAVPLNPCAHAYRKKHSSVTNAQEHVGRKYLVNIDIKSFFPSIHFTRVQKLFIKIGCSLEVSAALTKLTTYSYCRPQGTPTSALTT
jgi:RNA-directed DNA polymerase